jgi:DNA-binding GntR family transcriptional regulator
MDIVNKATLEHGDRLYVRVYAEIATQIASGAVPRGGRLPPERVLAEQLQVSRATLRRALAALRSDGLIEQVQGRGTFVVVPQLVEPANTLMSFTQLARDRSTVPGARVLEAHVRPANIDEADRFRIAPGSEVFSLERLRTMDGLPVGITSSVVPLSIAPEVTNVDWTSASLYELFARSGRVPVRADYEIEARSASAQQARQLGLAENAPVLFVNVSSYTQDARLIEIGRVVYRGDRYRFNATLLAERSQLRPVPAAVT